MPNVGQFRGQRGLETSSYKSKKRHEEVRQVRRRAMKLAIVWLFFQRGGGIAKLKKIGKGGKETCMYLGGGAEGSQTILESFEGPLGGSRSKDILKDGGALGSHIRGEIGIWEGEVWSGEFKTLLSPTSVENRDSKQKNLGRR